MSDYAAARRHMVDGQLRTNDVTDQRIQSAMLGTARERFAPAAMAAVAYLDLDLPVADNPGPASRRMVKPMTLGKLLQAAEITENDRILDVGALTGYSAAVLARLGASVVALEEDAGLAAKAKTLLAGVANVTVEIGPLKHGVQASGPYDVIIVEGAIEIEPEALCAQLSPNGRLLCVFGAGPAAKARIYRRSGAGFAARAIFDAAAPALPGFTRLPDFAF